MKRTMINQVDKHKLSALFPEKKHFRYKGKSVMLTAREARLIIIRELMDISKKAAMLDPSDEKRNKLVHKMMHLSSELSKLPPPDEEFDHSQLV